MGTLMILGSVIIVMVGAAMLTLSGAWKHYKRVYEGLDVRDFQKATDRWYNQVYGKNGFIWFANRNDFYLGGFKYLHNSFVTYLDPYSLYWYIKYKKWFKKNCSHLKA